MAKHQGLGRGFGEFFQRTDLEPEDESQADVSRETTPSTSAEEGDTSGSVGSPASGGAGPSGGAGRSGGSKETQDAAGEPGSDASSAASARSSGQTPAGSGSETSSMGQPQPPLAEDRVSGAVTNSAGVATSAMPGTSGATPSSTGASGATSSSTGVSDATSIATGDTAPQLSDGSRLQQIPVSRIHPNPRQPRRVFDEAALLELSESIAEVGLLQPVVVSPDGDAYELVMGERRWRAARLAGLDAIPAIVRATEAQDLLRDALLENLHRSQLNPLEEAAAYQQMLEDFGCTQEELSQRIKRSRPQIANTLRLMKLPRVVQRFLLDGALTAGHARALLSLTSREDQEHIANRIVDEGLSVRATERLVQNLAGSRTQVKPHTRNKPGADEEAMKIASRLADVYDTDVRVKRTKGKGRGTIVLSFEDNDDLERIMTILEGSRDPSTNL